MKYSGYFFLSYQNLSFFLSIKYCFLLYKKVIIGTICIIDDEIQFQIQLKNTGTYKTYILVIKRLSNDKKS